MQPVRKSLQAAGVGGCLLQRHLAPRLLRRLTGARSSRLDSISVV
jgi:hypothetical protein